MSSFDLTMETLSPLPKDALLGLMQEFREDPRIDKTDLGVGVYRNESGLTQVMTSVKDAERKILETQDTKTYEGPRGNVAFCEQIEQLVFGQHLNHVRDRLVSLATPGGCGAIYLAMNLASRLAPNVSVWISDPSWPNHAGIARGLHRYVQNYRYLDPTKNSVDLDALISSVSQSKPGDVIVIQGPCHNPTGIDLSDEDWNQIFDLVTSKQLFPIIDIAYHGLGDGLEEDLSVVIPNVVKFPQAVVCYSCSKNFGLYRERTGCVLALTPSNRSTGSVMSHLADASRLSYSMPPAHGHAVVNEILRDDVLKISWQNELASMRQRLSRLKTDFSAPLKAEGLASQDQFIRRGMFFQLDLTSETVNMLKAKHGIYIPSSGRVNVAGLKEKSATQIGETVANAMLKQRA